MRFLVVLLFATQAIAAATPPATVPIAIRRSPADAMTAAGLSPDEERALPLRISGCEGVVRLEKLTNNLEATASADGKVDLRFDIIATIEKVAEGPLAAPLLVIEAQRQDGAAKATIALDAAMADAGWEKGGHFNELHRRNDLPDAKFWTAVELRCSTDTPYRVTLVPQDVVYHEHNGAFVTLAVKALRTAISSDTAWGSYSLYNDGMFLIGPELYAHVHDDPELAKVASPKMMTIDATTGKSRPQLRIKGEAEVAAFGRMLRKYIGTTMPRIRAATYAETGIHWTNIGWDIEEPLLIVDYGAHKLVLDYDSHGKVFMIDELMQ